MAKVLVKPDVHLKPWMFGRASDLAPSCDAVVSLGDLVDDWGMGGNLAAYAETLDAAIAFAREFPHALWCCGNHDYCYVNHESGIRCSGFSEKAKHVARSKLAELALEAGGNYQAAHFVDGTLFSHAGFGPAFLDAARSKLRDDSLTVGECVGFANECASREMLWSDSSPLWLRPPRPGGGPYGIDGLRQVVGHTPVGEPTAIGDVLVADTFSTYPDGSPLGNRAFTVYDTSDGSFDILR